MRIIRLALGSAVVATAAVAAPGCSDEAPPVSKEAITSKTDTSQFQGMMKDMEANVKGGGKPAKPAP